jgi:hypothetical protein
LCVDVRRTAYLKAFAAVVLALLIAIEAAVGTAHERRDRLLRSCIAVTRRTRRAAVNLLFHLAVMATTPTKMSMIRGMN